MKDILSNFTSNNKYLYLPTKDTPRVVLAIDDFIIRKNSFKLYNPFSTKAKLLKFIIKCLCNVKSICNILTEERKIGNLIQYLNELFNENFISSIYIATEKDKLVIQLQARNNIFGYLKFPLNNIGEKRIMNEKKGYDIFYNLGISPKYIKYDFFNKTPFLLVKPIEGKFSILRKNEILNILNKLIRNKKFLLLKHPRIENIRETLKEDSFLVKKFDKITLSSSKTYSLVYEHGDFAPWNVINSEKKLFLFDLEYFKEDGLEYLDFIKYYYQIGRLLKRYNNFKLIKFIFKYLNNFERKILFEIFIFNEISKKIEENKKYNEEIEILKILEKK